MRSLYNEWIKIISEQTVPLTQRHKRQYPKTKCGIIIGHQFTDVKTIGMLGHSSTAFQHVLHEISVFDRNSNTQHTIEYEKKRIEINVGYILTVLKYF